MCTALCSKVPNQFLLLYHCIICAISVLLKMTQLRVVAEVRGVQGKEQRGCHCALGRSSAADCCVRCDVLQPDVLWSVSEVVWASRLGRIHWFAHFGRSLNQKVKQQQAFRTESSYFQSLCPWRHSKVCIMFYILMANKQGRANMNVPNLWQ